MRIYTLGTGHGDSTFCRFNSSTAYETSDGTVYLVDCGAPAEALLRRKGIPLPRLRAAFITHMHDDHAGGLSALLKQIIKPYNYCKETFTLYLPEEAAIEPLKAWMRAVHEDADSPLLCYRSYGAGKVYEDDNLTVTAISTCHLRTRGRTEGDPCSYALILDFKKEGKRILHTGDLRADFSDYPAIAKEERFDLCLCESTHYPPEAAVDSLRASKFDRLIFIHVADRWHNVPGFQWQYTRGEEKFLSALAPLPYPAVIAHDGDEFLL